MDVCAAWVRGRDELNEGEGEGEVSESALGGCPCAGLSRLGADELRRVGEFERFLGRDFAVF